MKIIGLTGGVGTGKSTVLEYIKENYNIYPLLTDLVGHRLQNKGEINYNLLVNEFGDKILNEDKTINRKILRELCFSDIKVLERVNNLTSENIMKAILEEIEIVKNLFYDYIFIESAILFESGLDKLCDEIWFVYSEEEIRIERIMRNRNYTRQMCEELIKKQLSEDEFKEKSTHIIYNNNDFEETKKNINNLFKM